MLKLKYRLSTEMPSIEAALQEAVASLPEVTRPVAEHIFSAGGKRLRPFLVVMVARLLGYKGDNVYNLAICMEMLHAATLLHDDILDQAETRRGRQAAHLRFGTPTTILAGDAMLATANQLVAKWNNPALCASFAEATAQTAAGEIIEIQYMRDLTQAPSVYDDIVRGKTAWLLRASCLMGAQCAGASTAICNAAAEYGENIGMAFQMVDDAIDMAPQAVTGKPTGGDLREGKLTPPVRLYRESLDGDARTAFDAAFTGGTLTDADAERIAAAIRGQGFDAATRTLAGEYLTKARHALEALPPGEESAILEKMIAYIQNREK